MKAGSRTWTTCEEIDSQNTQRPGILARQEMHTLTIFGPNQTRDRRSRAPERLQITEVTLMSSTRSPLAPPRPATQNGRSTCGASYRNELSADTLGTLTHHDSRNEGDIGNGVVSSHLAGQNRNTLNKAIRRTTGKSEHEADTGAPQCNVCWASARAVAR